MRKALGMLFAASLLVSVGVAASGPAGSAVNTKVPKCKSIQGTQTFTPGLPKSGSSQTVKPVTKTMLSITGCTGAPGITKGSSNTSSKATTATNCNKLLADAAAHKPAKATTGVITWSNKQTTTTSNVLTVTGINKDGTLAAKLVSHYTKGLGKGKTSTVLFKATPNKGWCTKTAFTKTSFKSTSVK
jgi:phage FluMu protein Com